MYQGKRERPLPVLVRDKLGGWLADEQFAGAYGVRGKPGWPPSRLALVTVFQMVEDLTDRQAAEAVRTRIDWKYALGLDLADPGFDHSVLSEFRARVAGGGLDQVVLDTLLERLAGGGLVGAGGKMRTDSTHVIAAVRDLNRLELAGESVRACLEALAVAAPQVVAQLLDDSWGKRYAARIDTWRMPASETKKAELALAYGRDGHTLLKAVYAAAGRDRDLAFLAGLHQVEVLRVVLLQNYLTVEDGHGREVIKRREADAEGLPPGRSRITSPYDTDARWGVKRDTFWNGYKVHVTETCDTSDGDGSSSDGEDDGEAVPPPHLITNVETTDATVPDSQMTAPVHARLAGRGLLPDEHYVDSGYPSAELLVSSLAVKGHRDFPVGGHLMSSRTDRLCPSARTADLLAGLCQWRHSLSCGGFGEAEAGALGEDEVRVVEQAVYCRGGQGLGHDRVESAGVQVGCEDQGSAFVGGVDEPVEGFGGGLPGGEHADVVDGDQVAAGDLGDCFGGGAVDGGAAEDGGQ